MTLINSFKTRLLWRLKAGHELQFHSVLVTQLQCPEKSSGKEAAAVRLAFRNEDTGPRIRPDKGKRRPRTSSPSPAPTVTSATIPAAPWHRSQARQTCSHKHQKSSEQSPHNQTTNHRSRPSPVASSCPLPTLGRRPPHPEGPAAAAGAALGAGSAAASPWPPPGTPSRTPRCSP